MDTEEGLFESSEELEIWYWNLGNKDLKLWETMEVPFGNGKTWAKIWMISEEATNSSKSLIDFFWGQVHPVLQIKYLSEQRSTITVFSFWTWELMNIYS